MIEIKGYTLGFHIALLSSAINEADYSSNYVVIVTATSHRAICVRLCLDSADWPSFRSRFVRQSLHVTFLCQTRQPSSWIFMLASPHANATPAAPLCVFLCASHASCRVHASIWECHFSKTEQSEVKNNRRRRRLKCLPPLSRARLRAALSFSLSLCLQTADFCFCFLKPTHCHTYSAYSTG